MVSALTGTAHDTSVRERVLVVADQIGDMRVAESLRRQIPQWSPVQTPTYLTAIAELIERPASVVVACVNPAERRLKEAISGLRLAAGNQTRLVLCCTPASEPMARAALVYGANDYLLYPIGGLELEKSLGISEAPGVMPARAAPPKGLISAELALFARAVQAIQGPPALLPELAAELIRLGMRSSGVTLVAQGSARAAGEPVLRPVLTAPLQAHGATLGQVSLGPGLDGAYTPEDVQRLTQFASLAAGLLHAATEQRRLYSLAVTDECSGLANRRHLVQQLDVILARAAVERFPVTVLLFDIDDFKSFNDEFGHDAGDEIIRTTGELFRRHSREQDVVTRYGGDEFAVVFWDPEGSRVAGSSHPASALGILDRFRQALLLEKLPRAGSQGSGRVTISGGLATYPWDGSTREALLRRADEALRAAKRAGKNRVFLIGDQSGT